MKVLHCLLMLALVLSSSAAPNKLKRSDSELSQGAYCESENVLDIPDRPLTPEEQAEQDRVEQQADQRDSTTTDYQADPVDASSYVNHTLTPREDKWSAELWMSEKRVNIGSLRGPRLYWKLYNCFQALCPQKDTHWECNNKPGSFVTNTCKIENVVSTKFDDAYDATGTVFVSFTLVKNDYGTNLSPPTVYGIFRPQSHAEAAHTNAQKARHARNNVFRHDRAGWKLPLGGLPRLTPNEDMQHCPYTVFIATIRTDNKDEAGEFHCDGPLRKRIYDFFHNSAKQKLMDATHNSVKGYIEAHVKCQAGDECWDYKDWRKCYDKGVW